LSNLAKGLILLVVVVAIGGGLAIWKKNTSAHSTESFNSISKEEIELLLADAAKSNPAVLKRLSENPELKKEQLRTFKELLAFASQAKKDGLADDPTNKQELLNIRAEIEAANYDREINKDKGSMPPFGFITEEQLNAYWGEGSTPQEGGLMEKLGLGKSMETRTHEAEFEDFLNSKIAIMKARNPAMANREISEEERKQAKDFFAKVRIYQKEYQDKAEKHELDENFVKRVNLMAKLQQAQFLGRLYSEKVADQLKVTDEEVDKYLAEHPELDTSAARAKAQGILDRAKAGEDFAALANEFSDDPGNGEGDQKKGGAYTDVPKGQMMPAFEAGALAVKAGEVNPNLVETDYGFHIVKLDRELSQKKGADGKNAETYDVRHILISTGQKDPENPNAPPMPVREFVRNKLETEKQKKFIDDLVAANNISVPEDFNVPEVTEEQMQEMMRQRQQQMQQQMQGPPASEGEGETDGPPQPKKDDKKK
jgi:hypothetical protein